MKAQQTLVLVQSYHLIYSKQQPMLENRQIRSGEINDYESRFNSVNFSNHKINEVIGWMLIIGVALIIAAMGLSIYHESVIGFAVPLLAVMSFIFVYSNWLSMKFFVHS